MIKDIKALFLVIPLVLSGCSKTPSGSIEGDFIKKKMPAYYYSATSVISVDTYFRKDKLTDVPHISLKNFYHLLTTRDMTINKTSKDVYEATANSETVVINTKNDTLEADNYEKFISTTVYRQEGVGNVYFDGAPFLRVKEEIYDTPVKHKSLSFAKYGIDLIGLDDDILLPVTTASNIFSGPTMITCFTTKDHIYFIDPNDFNYGTEHYFTNVTVMKEIRKGFPNGKRSEENASFSYNQLCFLIDNYYGLPGREYLHEELSNNRDLDAVLQSKNDMTRKARQFLKSTSMYEYFAGIEMLASFLSDAGHTGVDMGEKMFRLNDSTARKKINQLLDDIGFHSEDYDAKSNFDTDYLFALYENYYTVDIDDAQYKRYGDTLVYRFESFLFDWNGWREYYKDLEHNQRPNDVFSKFIKMLDDNENDSSIKNIVLDISLNGGGFGDMVVAMMGLMCGKTYMRSHDMVNDNIATIKYDFDANFDGVFDEKDQQVKYHYNFGILTSAYSFSCGNLLPAEAKDNDIMVLGDKSGGGCCAVLDTTTLEGLYVRLSSQDHFVTNENEEVEFGVVPHAYLYEKNGNEHDFSKFYDFSYISSLMNEYYGD